MYWCVASFVHARVGCISNDFMVYGEEAKLPFLLNEDVIVSKCDLYKPVLT